MRNKSFRDSMSGKGYYIALILCAVAIGITGYLYYRSNDAAQYVAATDGVTPAEDSLVAAVATSPQQESDPTGTTSPLPPKPAKTMLPVSGETIAAFSMDALQYNQTTRDWRVHDGIDIAAEAGTVVCAAADGEVYTVYEDDAMGTTVVIRHDGGYTTKYASLDSEVSVAAGDTVTVGQAIGKVGVSALLETGLGDHVHFAVTCDGETVDPMAFVN